MGFRRELLRLFALARDSGERVRERGPLPLRRRAPLPAFAGRGADLSRRHAGRALALSLTCRSALLVATAPRVLDPRAHPTSIPNSADRSALLITLRPAEPRATRRGISSAAPLMRSAWSTPRKVNSSSGWSSNRAHAVEHRRDVLAHAGPVGARAREARSGPAPGTGRCSVRDDLHHRVRQTCPQEIDQRVDLPRACTAISFQRRGVQRLDGHGDLVQLASRSPGRSRAPDRDLQVDDRARCARSSGRAAGGSRSRCTTRGSRTRPCPRTCGRSCGPRQANGCEHAPGLLAASFRRPRAGAGPPLGDRDVRGKLEAAAVIGHPSSLSLPLLHGVSLPRARCGCRGPRCAAARRRSSR